MIGIEGEACRMLEDLLWFRALWGLWSMGDYVFVL